MSKRCMLCLSPYRKEVVSSYKNGVSQAFIYKKYREKLGYTSNLHAFRKLLQNHIKSQHNESAILIPQEQGLKAITIENFGQIMLELGMAKISEMTPQEIQLKDVVAAQKLVLDSKKLKLSESSMELMLAKMFAPPLKVIEGETV